MKGNTLGRLFTSLSVTHVATHIRSRKYSVRKNHEMQQMRPFSFSFAKFATGHSERVVMYVLFRTPACGGEFDQFVSSRSLASYTLTLQQETGSRALLRADVC